jgi:hypothetical protein
MEALRLRYALVTVNPWIFDFFSDQPLDKSGLYKSLPILADATVIQDTPDSLGVLVPVEVSAATESVKLSFFGNMDNGRVSEPGATLTPFPAMSERFSCPL